MHPHIAELQLVFNLQTKFEISSFIVSKDIAWAHNIEMSHVTLTTPTWGIVMHHAAKWYMKFEVSSSTIRDTIRDAILTCARKPT